MEAAGATGTKGEGDVKKHRVTLGDQIALTSLEFKNSTSIYCIYRFDLLAFDSDLLFNFL